MRENKLQREREQVGMEGSNKILTGRSKLLEGGVFAASEESEGTTCIFNL